MDFTRLKKLVVPEGTVKKVEIGGKTVWEAETKIPYLGPNLGSSLTELQSTAIRASNFDAIRVGDYWTFSNVPYTYLNANNATVSDTYSGTMRVADCDYYLNTGDIPCTTHHVVVVPDANMYNAQMNSSDTTAGGYVGSRMRTVHLRRAEAIFKACFGESHVLKHREYLVKTVNTSASLGERESAGAWYNSLVELMDERMVYGSAKYANTSLTSVSNKQLTLFKNNSSRIATGNWYWLRNVSSGTNFAFVALDGYRSATSANSSSGVRPAALIY